MEAYKPYVDYIMAGGVAEMAFILTKEGVLCGTNTPIETMPTYNFDLEDDTDPSKTHSVVVDEKANLLEAIANSGVTKNKAGIRIYNQKYYPVKHDPDNQTLYLKKVTVS